MSRRLRASVLLLALFVALGTGSYWLWRALDARHGADGPDAPGVGSARRALGTLSGEPQPGADASPPAQRKRIDPTTRERAAGSDPEERQAILSGALIDTEGRAVIGARIFLAPWIEDDELDPSAHKPLVPARIAVHLPLDVADPERAGLPVPLLFASDDTGAFRAEFPPGRWRLLVRSRCAPYERNDLRLASGEARDLGRLVLRDGVVYRLELRGEKGALRTDARAAPAIPGLGAGFPPLGGALALPFLSAPKAGSRFRTSVPQRAVPLEVEFSAPQSRVQLVTLDPAQREQVIDLPDADRLRGGLAAPQPSDSLRFEVHARPLDFFESPLPADFRADVSSAAAPSRAFELEIRERGETYELRAAFSGDPPLLESPWSPPLFWKAPEDRAGRAEQLRLREPLLWRADAEVVFEVAALDGSRLTGPVEVLLQGIQARGFVPGEWIELAGPRCRVSGLRLQSGEVPTIAVRSAGGEELTQPLPLVSGAAADLGRLALDPRPSVRIRAVDASSGQPIPGALLSLASGEWGGKKGSRETPLQLARTDERGEACASLPPGAFGYFDLHAAGYAPTTQLTLQEPPMGTLTFALVRGANVQVRVVDSDGVPQRATRVECTSGSWSPSSGEPQILDARSTDAQGIATFAHAAPGEHAFRVSVPGARRNLDASEWSIVHLGDGEQRALTLSTRTRAELRVRVLSAGRLRPDLRVTVETEGIDNRSEARPSSADEQLPHGIDAWTDGHGEARFEDLDALPVRVTLSTPDSPLRLRQIARLRGGLNRLTFDFEEQQELAFEGQSRVPFDVALYVLPRAQPVTLDDQPIELRERELERLARLDRRGSRPDLVFPAGEPIEVPEALAELHLRFSAPGTTLALDRPKGLGPSEPGLLTALRPTTELELRLRSLQTGERYVLLLGQMESDEPSARFSIERALPFVATEREGVQHVTGLEIGALHLLLTRVSEHASGHYLLRPLHELLGFELEGDDRNVLALSPTR